MQVRTFPRWPIILGLFWLTGCRTDEPTGPTRHASPSPVVPGSREATTVTPAGTDPIIPKRIEIGRSVESRPIDCEVHGKGRDVVLILATIHGDEAAGTPIVRRLGRHLRQHPELLQGRSVVLVPVANPDGRTHRTRHNVGGVDLNRNFPAGNFSATKRHGTRPLSQPESRALHRLLDTYRPDRIVSIHQPLSCIDYDGPARALAEAMGAHSDLPVKRLGSRPGSLGSHAGLTRNIPIITLELPRAADQLGNDAKWKRYGPMLLAAVTFPKAPPGAAAK